MPPIIRRVTAADSEQEQRPEVVAIGRRGRSAIIQLTLRTGALRVISLVGTVVLARVLLPQDFGAFAVIAFLIGVLAPVADLGMAAALIQKRDRPTENDIATVFTTQQVVWSVLFVVTFLLAPLISLVPGLPADADWMLRLTAAGLWVNQMRSVPVAMMTRVLRFGPLATVEVIQQVVYVVVTIAAAVNGGGVWSFVLGLVAHFTVGTVLTFIIWGRLPGIGIDRASFRSLLGFGMSYQSINLLHLVREAVVPLFGGLAGGVAAIGYLNFGQRFGRLVSGIDEIVGRVAFPTFSRLQGDATRVAQALLHVVETTTLVLSLALGWSIAVAPTLIVVAFSEKWAPAVPVFQLTAAAALAAVPASFIRGLALSVGLTRPIVTWSVVAVVATFIVFPFLVLALGLVGGGLGFVLHSSIQLFGFSRATRGISPFPWIRMARIYAIGAIAGIGAAVTLLFVGDLPGLIVSGIVFLAIYGGLVLAFEREQLRRSWKLVRGGAMMIDAKEDPAQPRGAA